MARRDEQSVYTWVGIPDYERLVASLEQQNAELKASMALAEKLNAKTVKELRDDLAATRKGFVSLTERIDGDIDTDGVTLEDVLRALEPFAHLGKAVASEKSKPHSIFVGQVIRGATPDDDRYHPVFHWNLTHAARIFDKLKRPTTTWRSGVRVGNAGAPRLAEFLVKLASILYGRYRFPQTKSMKD